MIRRSPAETYIKYLLLHPKKYSNADVIDILRYAQLDFLGEWYLTKLREQLDPPSPFYPSDVNHRATNHFLYNSGLVWIFRPDEAGRKAFKILEKPRIKEFVEAMLISGAPSVAIAMSITRQRSWPCTAQTIERYKDFFWNMDLVDSTELRALLQLRLDWLQAHPDPQVRLQHDSMKRAFWNDSRKTAADMPFSPVSSLIAQMRMGVSPSRLDLAKVLEQTRHVVALRMYESAANNGRGDSSKAFDYATVLEKATNVLEVIVKPDEELRKELSAIALRTTADQIPTVHQLGSGTFTTDVGPKESSHELPGDLDEGTASPGDPGQAG